MQRHRYLLNSDPLAIRPPHFAPRAKRMIVIHLTGSPPHLDMYDHKPQLVKRDGEECPAETIAGKTVRVYEWNTKITRHTKKMETVWPERHGALRCDTKFTSCSRQAMPREKHAH